MLGLPRAVQNTAGGDRGGGGKSEGAWSSQRWPAGGSLRAGAGPKAIGMISPDRSM